MAVNTFLGKEILGTETDRPNRLENQKVLSLQRLNARAERPHLLGTRLSASAMSSANFRLFVSGPKIIFPGN